jgi:hypothetical protein
VRVQRIEPDGRGTVWPRGSYGRWTTVTVDGVEYALGVGTSDGWELYRVTPHGPDDPAPTVAVVARNGRLGYLGVEVLDPDRHETVADPDDGGRAIVAARPVVFFQDTYPGQVGPRDTLDYDDRTVVRRVLEGFGG